MIYDAFWSLEPVVQIQISFCSGGLVALALL
jgi:hypothetical protein